MEAGNTRGFSKPREGPWGLQSGLEDKVIAESLQWPKFPWEQRDLALGLVVSRADASSISRMLDQPQAGLCQVGRRMGAFLGGSDFCHLSVLIPWLCPPWGQWENLCLGLQSLPLVFGLHLVDLSPTF